MRNILVIEDSSKATFGGGQKVTLNTMAALRESYEFVLFDTRCNSEFARKARSYIRKFVKIHTFGTIKQSERSSFSLSILEVFISPVLAILNAIIVSGFVLSSKLSRKNSIIYATTKKGLMVAYIIKRLFNIEYIYHAHSIDDRDSLYYRVIAKPLNNANSIICVSDAVNKNIFLESCVTIYNSIAIEQADYYETTVQNKLKNPIVSSISSLLKCKGLEYFMQSYDFVDNPDVVYKIWGEGKYRKELEQFASKRVRLCGFSSRVEEELRDNITILVCPSVAEEACPMNIIEAIRCGVPVITTNIGGQSELVIDGVTGFHVPVKDPKSIAERINYLLQNSEEYVRMVKNCFDYAPVFSFERYRSEIRDVFSDAFGV